jgi:hypothetical protein
MTRSGGLPNLLHFLFWRSRQKTTMTLVWTINIPTLKVLLHGFVVPVLVCMLTLAERWIEIVQALLVPTLIRSSLAAWSRASFHLDIDCTT